MKILKLLTPIFSVNKMFSRKVTYSKAFYNWREDFCYLLHKDEKELVEISNKFKPTKHALEVEITRYIPKDLFYTKTGNISSRSGDLTNHEKSVVDAVLIPSLSKKFIKGIFFRNIEIDDTYVCNLHSYKRPTKKNDEFLELNIKIISNKTFK